MKLLVVTLLLTAAVHAVCSQEQEDIEEYDSLYNHPAYNDRDSDVRDYDRPYNSDRSYSRRNYGRHSNRTYGSVREENPSSDNLNYGGVARGSSSYDTRRAQSQGHGSSSYGSRRAQSQGRDSSSYDTRRAQSHGRDSYIYDSRRAQSQGQGSSSYDSHRAQSQGSDSSSYDSRRAQSQGRDSSSYDTRRAQSHGRDSYIYDSRRAQSQGQGSSSYDSHRAQSQGSDSSSYDSRRAQSQGPDSSSYDSRRAQGQGPDSSSYDSHRAQSLSSDSSSYDSRRAQGQGPDSSSYDSRRAQGQVPDSSSYDSHRAQGQGPDSSSYDSRRAQGPDSSSYDSRRTQGQGPDSSSYDSRRAQGHGPDSSSYDSRRAHGQGNDSSRYNSRRYESPSYDRSGQESLNAGSSSYDSRQYESLGYDSPRQESSKTELSSSDSREYGSPGRESPDTDPDSYPINEATAYEEVEPVEDHGPVCARTCRPHGDVAEEVWAPGKVYQYSYRGHVTSTSVETDGAESSMVITATVSITANTLCDLKLKVMDMRIADVADEDSLWFREAVQDHDLHFSYQGGKIEHLCPHDDENAVATNFKRGILSSLQMSISNLAEREQVIVQESDVSGECETRYTVIQLDNEENSRVMVNKTKNNCRADTHFPYIPYSQHTSNTYNSEVPLFGNKQSCQMTLTSGVWERVECTQELTVDKAPWDFGSHAYLASTTVSSSLLLHTTPYDAQDTFLQGSQRQRRESLRMDLEGAMHADEARQHQESSEILEQVAETLTNLLTSMRPNSEIEEQRPHFFSHLVSLLGQLKQEVDLDDVWDTYGSEEDHRELLLDALLLCERGPCIHLVSRLVQEDHLALTPNRLTTWLTGLHFHTHTDPLAITHVLDVAQSQVNVAPQAVMAASSMVYRMCQQDSSNCLTHAQPFLEYVREEIGDSCGWGESRERQQQVKQMLRALGNAGVLPDHRFPEMCYMNKMLVPELRVAALQTYRRSGCADTEAPWTILEDVDEKVDVRIAAFLALVPCATHTPGFFMRISNLLEKEDVNQVGSYIWTHMCNLAEQPDNSEHSKQLAKLMAQHNLHDKFNTNAFRTSRNYRYAQFSEMLNLGGSVDTDVIYTPESYLPRQAAVNLTLDLMDKSINIFEFGGDFRGLEDYIERLFGKNGYFENEGIQKVLGSLKPKNDVHQEKVEEFQRLYDEARTKNELETEQGDEEERRASLYLRMFGNEVVYLDNVLNTNPLQLLQQLIHDFTSPKSFQVVNQEFLRATLLGFPLRLKLNATGSVTFSRSGTFEMRGYQNILMEGKLSSSAVVAMDEMLMVDGYTCSSGIRRRTTHLSHLDIGGKFSLEDGQIVDARIDMPKSELAAVSSSVKVSLYKNLQRDWEEQRSETADEEKEENCFPESLSNALGVSVCSSHSHGVHGGVVPGAPYETQVTVSKSDNFDYYVLSFRKLGNTVEALFDTPGSSYDRRVSFQVDVRPDGAEGYIVIPGRGVEGQYENTGSFKMISLQYQKNSELQGEFELSLQITKEGINTKFAPKLFLSVKNVVDVDIDGSLLLGPDVFRAEGSIMTSLQAEAARIFAKWEQGGGQHKVEAGFNLGQMFISTYATLLTSPEKTMLQATCEYGSGPGQSHSLSFTLDSSQLVDNGQKTTRGYLSMQSSQAEAYVDLDFKYQPGHAEASTNISVFNTEVSSQLVLKNIKEGDKRDFQVTVSFASPQLNINYLGQAIYKVSNQAGLVEAEVNLGSLLFFKLALTSLQEDDPLHLLSGFHFQINDFIIQSGYNIDLSKPDQVVILISSTVGPLVGVLHLEAEYNPQKPFNVSLEAYAGYDTQQAGLSLLTSSDPDWQHFSGKTKLKWFDWSYNVEHKALWSPDKKQVKFFCGETSVEATLKSSPNPYAELQIHTNSEESSPDLQIAIKKQEQTDDNTGYEAYVKTGSDILFHFSSIYSIHHTFTSSIKLLESEIQVYGEHSQPEPHLMESKAQVTVTLPSKRTFDSFLSFSHSYDGITRDVKVSHRYNNDIIEGHMTLAHHDGWFMDDTLSFIFSLTTPFAHLHNVGFTFESHGDPSLLDFVEVEWEDLKIRGEAQLSDPTNLEAKLLYEDGGTCNSHIHIYHKFDGLQYLTGATLGVTAAHAPWSIQVITNLGQSGMEESVEIQLSFQSPLLTVPFQLHGTSKVAENHLALHVQAEMEEKVTLTFSGKNEFENMNTRKFLVGLDFNSPWTEPVHLNITNTQNDDCFNVTIDFWSFLHPINSLTAEFNAVYAVLDDIKAHFYLSHDQFQVNMDLSHSLADRSMNNHFEASVNSAKITGQFDAKWDGDFVPVTTTGQLSFVNLFEHQFDITLSQTKEHKIFKTELVGLWDELIYRVDHQLNLKRPLEWSNVLQVTLPDQEEAIAVEISLNAQYDFSSVNSSIYFVSPWTKDTKVEAALQMTDSLTNFEFKLFYDNDSIIKLILQSTGPVHWCLADLELEVTSSFFKRSYIKWEHNLETENLVFLEITHGANFPSEGNDFYFKGTGNLVYNQGWYDHEFSHFDYNLIFNYPRSQIDLISEMNIDSQFSGNLRAKLNDYVFSIGSAVYDGLVFKGTVGVPELMYETELKYEMGNNNFPDLHYRLARNSVNVFTFANKFGSVYPKFDALFTMSVLMERNNMAKNGQLRMKADLTNIHDYAFNSTLKLETDFEGFENYWAELDTDVNIQSASIDAHFNGLLHINDWHYKTRLIGSLELGHDISLEYTSFYDLTYDEHQLDQKEVSFSFTITNDEVFQGKLTVQVGIDDPQWTLFLYYSKKEQAFESYVIPGNTKKYEMSAQVNRHKFSTDAQITSSDGSKFQVLQGSINWNIRRRKKQFSINMSSDYDSIKKIMGQVILQQKKGLAANANFRVNEENFVGSIRYIFQDAENTGRISIRAENNIYLPFKTDTNINFSIAPNKYESDLVMDLNDQKGWFSVNVKASLPDSYLRLQIPYEGFENIDLTVNIDVEDNWGVKVSVQAPKFCANFEGTLHKSLENLLITINIQRDCTGEAMFAFKFSYAIDKNSFDLSSNCHMQDYGSIYKFEIISVGTFGEGNLKMEGQVYPQHSIGVELIWTSRETLSFMIRAYDLYVDVTHFQFKYSSSLKITEIILELNQRKLLSVDANYDLQPEETMIDATYSHSLFGSSLNVKFTAEISMKEDEGNMKLLLTTDKTFEQADLFIEYNLKEEKQGNFKLSTSLGNAEGNVVLQETEKLFSVSADMISSLHSFREYYFKFDHEQEADNHHFKVISVQDDIEFQLKVSSVMEGDTSMINLNLLTPFKEYENFDIGFSYPEPNSPEKPYLAHIHMLLSGSLYGININHNHQESWRSQKTEVTFISPKDKFSNVSASFMYDIDGQVAVQFNASQGSLGIESTWHYTERNIFVSITFDLKCFDLGKYLFSADIPLLLSQNGEIIFERRETDLDLIAKVTTGEFFRHANISFVLMQMKSSVDNASYYMMSYELDNSLKIDGQYEGWKAMAELELGRNKIPGMSGSFKINTNIEGYEAVDGMWNIRKRAETYSAEINIDMKHQGTIALSVIFDAHPQGARKSWESGKLTIFFESPFTLTHHIKAEYQLNAFSVAASYQYGLDTFQIKFNSKLKRKVGTISLTGNIPVRGISTFTFDLNYGLKDTIIASLVAIVEQTTVEANLELGSYGIVGSVTSSVTSPFVLPIKAALSWSFNDESSVYVKATFDSGKHTGELKMTLEDTHNSKQLELLMKAPFEMFSTFDFRGQFTSSESDHLHASANLTVNHHVFKTEFTFINRTSEIKLEFSGFIEVFGSKGSLEMVFGRINYVYESTMSGKMTGYKPFHIVLTFDSQHIQSTVKYNNVTLLSAHLNFSQLTIKFAWEDYTYFSLRAHLTPADDGYEFELELNSSVTKPLTIQLTYSDSDGHKGNARITLGDTVYKVNATVHARKRQSTLEFHLDSSENPHTPVIVKVAYDLKSFLRGRMNSMEDLASASFEWGDAIHLKVTGMHHRNRAKVNIEISTPFKSLPKLRLGFDGEFLHKRSVVDFTFTAFVDWSQKITLTGFFKHKNRNLDLHFSLTTPYPILEKLSISMKFNSGHIESTLEYNSNEWHVVCDYTLSPSFSLTLTAKTPVTGFESLTFVTSAGLEDGVINAHAELTWQETNTVKLQVEMQLWTLEIKLSTPWKPLQEASFMTSLRTESEELMFIAALVWDERKVTTTIINSPVRFQLLSKYEKNSEENGLARAEYQLSDQEFKCEIEIQTPFKSFKSLELALNLGAQDHQFKGKFDANNKKTLIECIYAVTGGKFTVDIPVAGDFMFSLEATNMWMEMYSHVAFVYPEAAVPLTASFNYHIHPDDTTASLDINFESPNLSLESLNFNMTGSYDKGIGLSKASSNLLYKIRDKQPSKYDMILTSSVMEDQLSLTLKVESDRINVPYSVKCQFPLYNVFLEEGIIEFVIFKEQEQLFKLSYETMFSDEDSVSRHIVLEFPEWSAHAQVVFTGESLSISFSYPEPATKHTLLFTWSDDFGLEKFTIGVELDSPYIDKITFYMTFVAQRKFTFSLDSGISYGTKKIDVKGLFQYIKKLSQIKYSVQVTSDWVGTHSVEANIQWLSNISADIILNSLDKEHNIKLLIDVTAYTVDLTCHSPWLPYEDIIVTGTINNDFEPSNIQFEGHLTGKRGIDEISAQVKLASTDLYNATVLVSVRQNLKEVFKLSGSSELDGTNLKIIYRVTSIITELESSLLLHFHNNDVKRRIVIEAQNNALLKTFHMEIINNKYWKNTQQITVRYNGYHFESSVEMGAENGKFRMYTTSDYFYYSINGIYNLKNNFNSHLSSKTSLDALQDFKIGIEWPANEDGYLMSFYLLGENDEETAMYVYSMPDSVMGRSFTFFLKTPFKGYEEFEFVTPQFNYKDYIFRVLLQYPGLKTGIVLKSLSLQELNSDMQFIIYLPFEKYEIMSLKFESVSSYRAIDVRVGKVGLTLSARMSGKTVDLRARVNDYSMKILIQSIFQRPSAFRMKMYIDFHPRELLGVNFFMIEYQYNPLEGIYFCARTDQEELLKAQVSWGSDKVFAITTPKRYPAYLVLNLASTKERNDYQLLVGVSLREDGSWDNYGFHIHQEILQGGRHLSLSGEASENQFHVEGTFSANSFHFNESLIFELNNKKMGYKSLFQREPGFFSTVHTGDIYVLLPAQTVHYKTNATSNSRELEMLSSFTWNEQDPEMPPITFKVNYNDNSFFGQMRHYLKAVFSHPDVKDIYLECDIKQDQNSPLHGSAELVDGNSPERNIVMMLDIQPVTQDGEHNIKVNISQPFSEFALTMDALVLRSVFTRGDYRFKYWSLTKEIWEDLNILTAVNTTNSGYDFSANIFSSQAKWGYSYEGDVHSWDNSATFNIKGNPSDCGEFWKFGTTINKHLPELLVYLDIGQKDQEAYEEGRLRIGLHNPVELGTVLDHKRFGEWSQDGAVGLKLITPDILQFIFEFDPSLDYSDSSFLRHLTSPGDKILNTWWHDLTSTAFAFNQWISAEGPIAIDVLINQQTLQAVLDSETHHYNDFIWNIHNDLLIISENITTIWYSSLQPALAAVHSFITILTQDLLWYLQDVMTCLSDGLGWMSEVMTGVWLDVVSHLSSLQDQFIIWWNNMTTWWVATFNNMMYQTVRTMNLARGAIHECLLIIEGALQPSLQRLHHTLIRYGQELEAVLRGQCWYKARQMVDEMRAAVLEDASDVAAIMWEFLQPMEYYSRLLQVVDKVKIWVTDASTIVEDGFHGLQATVQESPMFQFLHEAQQQIQSFLSEVSFVALYDLMEQGVSGLWPYVSTATEEVLKLWGENSERFHRFAGENIFFNYINVVAGNVYDRVLLMWQNRMEDQRHNLETLERQLLAVIDALKDLLNENSFFFEEDFVFEPVVNGKIMYNQHLPVPWASFLEAPQWYRLTNMFKEESPVAEAQRILSEGMDDITSGWEALHYPGAFTPPFTGTATIMGQHVTTFDLRHYQFLGPCSYLLFRDFVGGDFTVVGVYESEAGVVRLESVEVQSPATNATLHVDGTVDVTGPGAETFTSGHQSGVKIGGLMVTCNKVSQGCSFTVSGKYFGRLAGLLGNYNYEPSDDFRGPDGSHLDSAADMATKWAVSSKPCYQVNYATQLEELSVAKGVADCTDIFLHQDSLLSDCFYHVDPQPYFWHCINDHNRPQYKGEVENGACKAVATYRTQCLTHGISVPSVDKCVTDVQHMVAPAIPQAPIGTGTCTVAGETVPNGWSHIYEGETEGSADIALIVELANCNKDKNLQMLLKLLNVHLRKTGIQDVRYTLITVKGDNVELPTAFMNDKDMSALLGTLVLEGPKVDHGGPEAVISTAKNLRWRPGVSRSILQLSCRACNEGDAVLQALQSNDVTLHIVTKFKVFMSAANKKKSATMASKLIGFDEKYVFTPRDIKKFSGNVKMRAALQEPDGSCIEAAQASGGSVFSMNKWITTKNEAAKKFLRVLNQRLTFNTVTPECQECRCITSTTEADATCRKCSDSSGFPDFIDLPQVPQSQVEEMEKTEVEVTEVTKKNLTIKADIKKDFIEQFVDDNAAFALVRSDDDESDEDSHSDESDESEEEEEKQAGGYEERRGVEERAGEDEEMYGGEEQAGEDEERYYDYYYESDVGSYDES